MATPKVQLKLVRAKLFFSLFLLCLWTSSIHSQYALSPDFVPSADANSLGKYGYFPVSYYTGQANIKIPLHTLETNGRTLDIALDYDASGIMPDVHPGWVGQNWSLSGPGVITRSVQGQPDEEGLTQGAFYLNHRISYIQTVLELSDWFSEDSTDTYEELSNFALDRQFLYGKTVDAEPDIYSFSFLGMAGKFYLANDGNWKVISDHNLKIEFDITDPDNYQNPLIEYVPGTSEMRKYEDVIKGFKIIDSDGYTFTFGYDTNAVEYSLPFFRQYSGPAFFGDPDWTVSAWYLTKIEDYRGTDIFVLEYERSYFTAQPYENQTSISSGCKLANGNWSCCNQSVIKKGGGSLISPVYLTSIESNRQERVEFRTSITNQKPFTWTSIFEMESNDIIDFICPGSGGCPYTPFPFLQEEGYYSYDPSGAFPNPFNGLMWLKLDSILVFQKSTHLVKAVELQFNNDPDERLNLLEVNFIGNDLYDNPEPEEFDYNFDYNQFDSLPDYFSREIDHFGYYNGNPDGTSGSFPFYDFEGLDTTYFEARSSDEDFLMIGQLTEIHYPTGGRTEFDFEPHSYTNIVSNDRQSTYSESGIVGGLRIKEIRNYDAIIGSPATAKTYHYVQEYEAGDTTGSGILAFKPKYAWVDWLFPSEFWPDGGYRESNWSTNVLVPLGNKFESHIGYSDVAEVNQDGSYTIYSFLTQIDIKDDLPYADLNLEFSPYARFSDKSHLRGKNTAIKYFGDDDELVQSIDIFYRDSSELPGFNEYAISINAGFGYNCPESNGDYYFRGNALKIFHNKHLVDSVRTRRFYDGDYVQSVESNLYSKPAFNSNKYAFLQEKSITNSDGNVHSEEFEYSFDHVSVIMGQQTFLDNMVDDHRFPMVLSEKKVNDTLVDGTLNLFGNFSGTPEVNKVRRYEATWDAMGDLTGSWEDQMEITSYNTPFLLPIVTSKTGWEDEVRFWSGTGRILRKFYLDHNRYWAYHANDQLKTFIEIDSLKKEFKHDAFSRIDTILDLPKNIVHSYEYYFGNDPMERSYFKSKTDFPLAGNSDLDSIVAYTYVDGLGRPVQHVNKYASPLPSADVITKTEYDNTGRVHKSYEPIEANGNDGSYYTGSFNGGFHESVYLLDPLNRISSITPPGWHASLCSYATNSTPITSPYGQLFPVHSLHL